jgi:hypothetical protein
MADEPEGRRYPWLNAPVIVALVTVLGAIAAALIPVLASGGGGSSSPTTVTSAVPLDKALAVTVEPNNSIYSDGWQVVMASPLPTTAQPSSSATCTDVRDWLISHGAVDVSPSNLKITIEGRSSATVVINDVRARVLSRDDVPEATLVTCPSAGANEAIGFGFRLSEVTPIAREIASNFPTVLGKSFFATRNVTVADGEALRFDVQAQADAGTYSWVIDIDAVVNGQRSVLTIDDDGHPFRTSSPPSAPAQTWDWAWNESPRRFVNCANTTDC